MVVAKLQAMAETVFSNCTQALEFFKALWKRKACVAGPEFEWMAFAREWTGQGRTFLVFWELYPGRQVREKTTVSLLLRLDIMAVISSD